MCWNEPVSWATLGIGTVVNLYNIYRFRNTTITRLSLAIQWLLLMQFFEALAWRSQNNPGKGLNATAAHGAMVANLTQPLVLGLLMLDVADVPKLNKQLAVGLGILYLCYILYEVNRTGPYNTLVPAKACHHLDLAWWSKISAIPYHIALFGTLFLLVRPQKFMIAAVVFLAAAFLLSEFFYNCGVGSMWCWFVAFLPIAITLFGDRLLD